MAWKPAYCSTAELRAYMGMGAYPTSNPSPTAAEVDEQASITLACESASRGVDRATGRQFGVVSAAVERLYTAYYNTYFERHSIEIEDVMSTVGLLVDNNGTALVAADYTLYPLNAAADGVPWTSIRFTGSVSSLPGVIGITALWGWTAVPSTIKNATLLQATRLFKRKDAPFGIAGSPEMTSELRLLARVDPDVEVMVRAYRRPWGAR